MPVHPFDPPRGRLEQMRIDSEALRGNLLSDPNVRTVAVYLPQGYDDTDRDYPLLVDLAGFTGSGLKRIAWQGFAESVPQRIDRLVASGRMGPAIVAFPDGFTSLGGNQYVDSPVMGRWEAFLLDEMIPQIEERFRVRRGPSHRAVFGKSSGGYGALIQGMRHGERWGAVACHSGDMAFDIVFRRDWPAVCDLLAVHEMDVARFIESLRAAPSIAGGEMHALMMLALAASYDPDPSAPYGIRLPVDPRTAELDPVRWDRWLEHDPLRMIERPECRQGLRSLQGLYIDCGDRDQYFLHYGARAFVARLQRLGIRHRFEEFAGTHSGIDHRLDESLPYLYRVID